MGCNCKQKKKVKVDSNSQLNEVAKISQKTNNPIKRIWNISKGNKVSVKKIEK